MFWMNWLRQVRARWSRRFDTVPARRFRQRRSFPRVELLECRIVPSGGVVPDYAVTQDWGSGFQGQVRLLNQNQVDISDWKLEFDYAAQISSIWDAQIVSHVANHYVIANAGWNSTLAAGSAVSFGFIGSPGQLPPTPTSYVLN